MTAPSSPAIGNPVEHIDPAWAGRAGLLSELAQRHGTPLYVYDLDVARARVALLRSALPAGASLYYSVKANPCPGILHAFGAAGCRFEVASVGELRTARARGAPAVATILVGPAKSRDLLRRARGIGIGRVVVESPSELERLRDVVREDDGPVAEVVLRLNPGHSRGALRMGGSSPFGMSAVDAERCLELAAGWPEVRLCGFHGFLASGLLEAADVVANARAVLEAAAPLVPLLPEQVCFLDLGGGFGIPYHPGESTLDLAVVGDGLRELVTPAGAEVCFEAGRFLVGPAGVLVSRVVDVKTNGGRRFVLLDGGSNACGLFAGRHTGRALPFQVLRNGAAVADGGETATICGPLCTPLDRLAAAVACAAVEGDLLAWHQCGAYGASAGLGDFLSFERPYEVVIEDGRPVWESAAGPSRGS